jgi:chromosome segregation ATPase
MDQEQLEKRVAWLDEERRGDKSTISELQKRISEIEGALDRATENVKELGSEVTRLSVVLTKVDTFDETINLHRVEVKKQLDSWDAQRQRRELDANQVQQIELENVNSSLAELYTRTEGIPSIKEAIQVRVEEDNRLQRLIAETRLAIDEIGQGDEERERSLRSIEDSRRQDTKRMTDIQGEVAALRKRADETRAKVELASDGQRKIDTRLNDIMGAEAERRETQVAFVEKVSFQELERERIWKDMVKRFEVIDKQSQELPARLQEIEMTDREVKRAQESFTGMTEQIDRRINEITEMQRLGEERFRQEWSAFKADDQKRWTNNTLTQEEQQREATRRLERVATQVTNLEDSFQEMQDIVQHVSEQTVKRLQALLTMARDWAADNDRYSSSLR